MQSSTLVSVQRIAHFKVGLINILADMALDAVIQTIQPTGVVPVQFVVPVPLASAVTGACHWTTWNTVNVK